MRINTLYGIGGGLLAGALVGYILGYNQGVDAARRGVAGEVAPPPMGAAAPAPGGGGGFVPSGPLPTDTAQRIETNRKLVQVDPKNRAAWVQLGNDYFDTHQMQKSIDAYGQALALQPRDPDVLTDQGVMYQEIGDYDRALANFEKAQAIDPRHVQSLFNIGVVQRNGKKDAAKAAAAWRKVIELAPGSPQAAQARQLLDEASAPR